MVDHIKLKYIPLAAVIVFALLSLVPPVLNGYPFVTADTGSYIRHAFDFQIPGDRSPFYGIFVGFSSLWRSLWLTVVAQSFILSYVFYRYYLLLVKNKPFYIFLIVALVINLFTAAGWVSGYVMPDIFAAILLLLSILYLLEPHRSRQQTVVYLLLIAGAVVVHNSHYIIFLLFSFTLLIISFFVSGIKAVRKSIYHLVITSVLLIIGICSLHGLKGYGFTISPGSHVFIMGRMVETGLLQQYLDDNCDNHDFKLCQYRNDIPVNTNDFLWASYSPLYQTGGWDSSKTEYTAIISDILSTPTYRKQFVAQTAKSTVKQLAEVQIDAKISSLGAGSSPWIYIKKHIPSEFQRYTNSQQTVSGFETGGWRLMHVLFFVISCILASVALIKSRSKDRLLILGLILLFFCCNALVSAGLSNVINRYQNRIFWILPASNFLIFVNYWLNRRNMEAGEA